MQPVSLRHTLTKTEEGRYLTVAFPVPPNAEGLTITYRYPKRSPAREVTVVDLGLEDTSGRFLGWSGSARDEISVGEFSSTPGYLKTPLHPGLWRIILGAYHIPKSGVEVSFTIRFSPKGPRWLRGDLHAHTDASDGRLSAFQLARKAKKLGLDFLAISNHNNYTDNLHPPDIPGLTVLPAVEWTHYKGHMNLFGPKIPFPSSFVANTREEMRALLAAAKAAGALVSVNHPRCGSCPYLWEDEGAFDMVEVWNGPMRPDNLAAISWWEGLLRKGRQLPLVGGSDFHRTFSPVRLGRPTTVVYTESPAAEDILAAVAAGRSYVTCRPNGPRLALDAEGHTFGETVPPGTPLTFRAENLPPGVRLRLVADTGPPDIRYAKRGGVVEGRALLPAARYAYLLAYRPLAGRGWPHAISNPLYFS